jgi:zeaxanthin glucosyltransferase
MAKFLLVVFADSGQLNPAIALAQHLEHAGHELAIATLQDDVAERCARAGVSARCFACNVPPINAPRREVQRSVKFATRLRNRAWVARWMQAVLVDQVPAQVAELREVVRYWRPDVVVVNAMAYAGAIVATLEGVVWAAFTTGLQGLAPRDGAPTPYSDLADARATMVRSLGASLEFRESDVISPWLDISFMWRELMPADVPERTFYVGAALPRGARGDERAFPFERLPADRPVVLVAFGSLISHPASVYEAIVGALGPEEATFVVVVKDLFDEPFVRAFPDNVVAVEWVPQLELLARSAVMINHGGANSVLEALASGVPVVTIPVTQEQELLGELVQEAGFGVSLASADASRDRCREILISLVAPDATERRRAGALRGASGAAKATELLARLAAEKCQLSGADPS